MKTRIVKIGNSSGICIPRTLLEQAGLAGEVELIVLGDSLVIQPLSKPRAGWDAAFQQMAERGDDALLDGDDPGLSAWDEEEWDWGDSDSTP